MAKDKFSATWVSHSSISDFLNCPRSYYLRNMWKRPETNHKVQLVSPALSLGLAIHEVVEALSVLPTSTRFDEPLLPKFEIAWDKYAGRKGGFFDVETEFRFKTRGMNMLKRVSDNPGPLKNLAVKINMDLPYYWLSEDQNILLCGKIDWLEYFKDEDAVGIIDFKTSKTEEKEDSLQLPIYLLLATNCQTRKVKEASYWYLESSDKPSKKALPDVEEATKKVLKIAKDIKLARTLNKLACPHNGCRFCEPLEKIFRGEAEFVGNNSFGQDCFIIPFEEKDVPEATIL